MLKLVPFNPAWINHDKIDIHAIYRRPRFKQDEYGELYRETDARGASTWDLTGALPIKQHQKWLAKGFEYVTLANRSSLLAAAQLGTITDQTGTACDWKTYDQHQTGGPWNYRKYAEGQAETVTIASQKLRDDVARFGPEAVEEIRRSTDPGFRLPDELRNPAPKVEAEPSSEPEPVAAATRAVRMGGDKSR